MTETKKTAAKVTPKKTLVEALAAFQADLPEIGLDKENPHFRSKFASLANISKIVLPKLAEHGLAFSVGSFVDNGVLIVDAHLIHESGESRSAQFPITETNPQKVGSSVTYYRRYALAALTGIVADEDDDGNAASAPAPAAIRNAQSRPAPASPKSQGSAREKVRVEWIETGKVDKEDVNRLVAEVKESGKTGDAIFAAVLEKLQKGEV